MTRHSFGPAHPLWTKLLELRRSGLFIKDLIKVAHEEGYDTLSYEVLRRGFQQVSSGFGLPTRTAGWLRRKHQSTAALINAMETMTFALMEVLEDWQAVKEERALPGHTEAYRTTLAGREHRLRDTAFTYSERIRKQQLELEKINAEEGGLDLTRAPGFVVTDVETMRSAIEALMGRWAGVMEAKLGGTDVDEVAIERFGHGNIRPELPEPPERTLEDEEDFTEEEE